MLNLPIVIYTGVRLKDLTSLQYLHPSIPGPVVPALARLLDPTDGVNECSVMPVTRWMIVCSIEGIKRPHIMVVCRPIVATILDMILSLYSIFGKRCIIN